MPSLIQGRIVYPLKPVADPQGRNPKANRPFVVISRLEDIKAGGDIQAVGITTALDESPREHYVELPWGDTAKTKLRQKSAALCTWLIAISQEDVSIGPGFVAPALVLEIVDKVKALHQSESG